MQKGSPPVTLNYYSNKIYVYQILYIVNIEFIRLYTHTQQSTIPV